MNMGYDQARPRANSFTLVAATGPSEIIREISLNKVQSVEHRTEGTEAGFQLISTCPASYIRSIRAAPRRAAITASIRAAKHAR